MSKAIESAKKGADYESQIAVTITGIVFWGLVVVGLFFTVFLARDLEDNVSEQYEGLADQYAIQIQRSLIRDLPLSDKQIRQVLEQARTKTGVDSASLLFGGVVVEVGQPPPKAFVIRRNLSLVLGGKLGVVDALLKVFYPPPRFEVERRRNDLLVIMGALLLGFGFVLQWVLKRVLTRPFLRMVDTAKAISGGDDQRRFDQIRNDEFGYLAKFINTSLDYVSDQADKLSRALMRIRQSEAALFQEKERAVVTLHSIGDAVITTDDQGCVEYLNPAAERLTDWSIGQVHGKPVMEVAQIVMDDQFMEGDPVRHPVSRCLNENQVIELGENGTLVRRDGRRLAIYLSASPIRDSSNTVIGAIMVFQDVTPTRQMARKLSYFATHDDLTGLCNRYVLEKQLRGAVETARNEGVEHALCYLDLDQFKIVNDTCGHSAGDELLRQLAALLKRKVRDSDVLARLGGDELGILIQFCRLDKAREIADELRQAISDFRFVWEGHSFEVGASIGLVAIKSDTPNVSELLSAADVACYAAKERGRNRVHVYTPNDDDLERRRGEMLWVSRITQAMEQDRFCLFYQPILPIKGKETDTAHYEILIRLKDEQGKLVPPMAFIPAAERYNLMLVIDRWVVRSVFTHLDKNENKHRAGVWTINLSGQSLGDETFLDFVLRELGRVGIDPKRICFEVTETAAMAQLASAMQFIERLKKEGCRFALDDFGSGLSSFGYLKNLNVDYIKIDGSFIRDITDDKVDYAMVESITHIGQVMGLEIVAEFVDSEEVLDTLKVLGVDYAQGYHIAKPQPLDAWTPLAIGVQSLAKISGG